MSMMDKLKELVGKSPDKVKQGIDKASTFADEKTGGKYGDQFDSGADKAKGYAENMGGEGDSADDESSGGGNMFGGDKA